MPIYEYICDRCKSRFDKLVRTMTSTAHEAARQKIACPACGSMKTARTLSVFAVASETKSQYSAPSCGRCGGTPGSCMNP